MSSNRFRTDRRPRTRAVVFLAGALCACLAGSGAALASVQTGQRATAPARTAVTSATYPRAGVILWKRLAAHSKPSGSSRVVKIFPQFRSDFRPTTLLAIGEAKDASGARWLRLSLPMRPNGRKGWVKAAAVATHPVRRSIFIDLSARKLRVLEHGGTRFATRIAVGRPGMETPTGRFYVTATYRPKEPFLGAHAFETSAYSKLSEWPGGGVVGLHGTSTPRLLGQAVSHGCVRMSNAAALVLERLVKAGTPLQIVA